MCLKYPREEGDFNKRGHFEVEFTNFSSRTKLENLRADSGGGGQKGDDE